METWDAIRARRNVRSFEQRPIPEDHLERILEAAWRSPSASNRQHWDFVLVTEQSVLEKLSTVWQGAGHIATSAATVVLVAPVEADDRSAMLNQYDLGQATMAMMVTATDLGIGSGHAAIGDKAACRSILGIPEDQDPSYLLAFGYPADRPLRPIRHPNRRPIEEVVHRGRW
jgi:nitroreductase